MSTEVAVKRWSVPVVGFKALGAGEPDGTFEAFVAVYNNVDFARERIIPGFFAATLEQWRRSGDPIPVIFSHRWDDLASHVGVANATDVVERFPGDPALPDELRAFGALHAQRASLDVDEDGFVGDTARALWKRMKRRSIREFSFAFDVSETRPADGGVLELVKGDLFEIGPTLKGMNPLTQLVDVRSRERVIVTEVPAMGAKILATQLAGSMEGHLAAVYDAARTWASARYADDLFAVHPEGTFADKALVTTERWSDPIGEGPLWELAYSATDGGVVIGQATEVAVTVATTPKARTARFAAAGGADSVTKKLAGLKAETAEDDAPATGDDAPAEDADGEKGALSPDLLRATLAGEFAHV